MEVSENDKRTMPGMFHILFSFAPWIVYWVLCGVEKMLGIIIPLVIGLLLVISQIRKKDLNLMENP